MKQGRKHKDEKGEWDLGCKSVGGEWWGSVLLLGRHLLRFQTHKKTRTKNEKKGIDWRSFLCGDQGGIPREQNRELTTT